MRKSVVISIHIGYWLLYVFFLIVLFQATRQNEVGFRFPSWFFMNVFASSALVPAMLGFYSFYTFLFTRFLKRKKILALLFTGILVCFISALLQDVYLSLVSGPGIWAAGWESALGITLILFFVAVIHGIIGLLIKGFITWYGDIKFKEELNKKNFETELALVKAQINPHFLFNTINNIDVLIGLDPEKASVYLNKLSDIMRFMLYETKTGVIPLSKEISYIEKYIDLQKIRTSNPNYVKFTVEGNAENLMLEPMLFIPFIENAFKHAENKKTENAITIKFVIEKDKTIFQCENSFSSIQQTKPKESGLGNDLIEKRLKLLYPKNHVLTINRENNIYKTMLIINNHEY